MEEWLTDYEERAEIVRVWWKSKKAEWKRQLAEDTQ
jgi:hypothetical protein